MTIELTNRQRFEISGETYWKDLCLNLAYQEALYREALKCDRMEVLENSGSFDTGLVRRLRFIIPIQAPAAIHKVVGSEVHIEQHSEFDAQKRTWTYRIVPSMLKDRIDIRGVMHVEQREGAIEQVTLNTIGCRMFGLGGIIEPFVARSTEDGHKDAAAFTRRWIAQHQLK
ncbi:MAG: DUF2505 family protein [Polyangiales bacterium]